MQTRTISLRDGRFQTELLEVGSGPPVLFLHGIGGLQPHGVVEALAADHRVIAPQHPGYGDSVGDDEIIDLWDLLYYYLDLLDALELSDVPLVGHSLGGMFAAELAALQPERFPRLALIAPFGLWDPGNPVTDYLIVSPQEQAAAMFYDPGSEAARTVLPAAQNEGDVSLALERIKSSRVAAKYLWPIPNRGLSKRLHRVSMPTVIIWGENDGIIPVGYAKDFQKQLPQATIKTVANAGHMVTVEQPDAVAEALRGFLAG